MLSHLKKKPHYLLLLVVGVVVVVELAVFLFKVEVVLHFTSTTINFLGACVGKDFICFLVCLLALKVVEFLEGVKNEPYMAFIFSTFPD